MSAMSAINTHKDSFGFVAGSNNLPSSRSSSAATPPLSDRVKAGLDAHGGKIALGVIAGAAALTLGVLFGIGTAGLGPFAALVIVGCVVAGGAIGGGTALCVAGVVEDQARKEREARGEHQPAASSSQQPYPHCFLSDLTPETTYDADAALPGTTEHALANQQYASS